MKFNQIRDIVAIAKYGSLRRAEGIQCEIERVRDEVQQLKGNQTGSIAIGLSTVSHIALLPRAMAAFQRRFPDIHVNITEGLFPAIERSLHHGKVDFYVGPLADNAQPAELTVEPLFDNRRLIFGWHGHPMAGATSLRDLVGARWVTGALTPINEGELTPIFASYGLPAPRVSINGQTSLSMIVTAASTDLLAMLPQQWLPILERGAFLTRIPVGETLSSATICMVSRSYIPLTPAAQSLADLFRRAAIHHAETLPGATVLTA